MLTHGDRLRVKKVENGTPTYYLRSSVLGGQVVAEINGSGTRTRGYVYLGGDILAVQQNNQVSWMHQDPVAKSKRVTDGSGNVVSTLELDPWGGETTRSSNSAFQPRHFTTYERDGNASDEAMHRRYNRWHSRFDQPDPYGGSYEITNPQSFNRFAYAVNDPVKFVDPTGLCSFSVSWTQWSDGTITYTTVWHGNCSVNVGSAGGGGGGSGGRPFDSPFVPEDPPPGGEDGDTGGGAPQDTREPKTLEKPCDTSPAAVIRAAQGVANTTPGARVGTQGGQTVISFKGTYAQTVAHLEKAGYYSGILAYNPIDHSGGKEFRTYGSPGFHFKVLYPQQKETNHGGGGPVGNVRFNPINSPATATDLHIDCNNPVGSGVGGAINHGVDFIRHRIPWWLPPLIPRIP